MEHTFYFSNAHTATRFHLSAKLMQRGWQKGAAQIALFSDQNLTLNDETAKHFEYKHLLAELLQRANVDFFPRAYAVNDENYAQVLAQITLDHYMIDHVYHTNIPDLKWILKPGTLNNGDDIKLFVNVEGLKQHFKSPKRLGGDHIIQQYITNPALYHGRKYTYRVWSIFTNFAGIYLYKQSYANISAAPYDRLDNFSNRKAHITNYVLNGELSNIEQVNAATLPNFSDVYRQMTAIVKRSAKILLQKDPLFLKPSDKPKMEFFGFDFLLDANGKCWLLEINQSPDCPVDPNHPLMPTFWQPFWDSVVDEFVIPSVCGLPLTQHEVQTDFVCLLEKHHCYRPWRALIHRLFSKKSNS